MVASAYNEIEKLPTGVPGLDHITEGGLPARRTTLVAGTSGSAKTVLGSHYLAAGIQEYDQSGIFITFEEPAEEIRRNLLGFGWDVAAWEREDKWRFVDVSPIIGGEPIVTGDFDFGGLMVRVEQAVKTVGAERVVLDSLGAVFTQFTDSAIVRRELLRVAAGLRDLGVTAMLTAERTSEFGDVTRHDVEEFVADNVIILRNVLEQEKRRRTVEVLKFRGTRHNKGEYPFSIIPERGIEIIPLAAIGLTQGSSNIRVTSGNDKLDAMCGGGFFRDSVVLVSGATGTGKTLMVTQFTGVGATGGEKCLLVAFEESRAQLFRNAQSWGFDFEKLEAAGKLRVVCAYPETKSLEDHLIAIRDEIETFKPDRVALDSLSALERVSSVKGFREFCIGLTSFVKDEEVATLVTSTTPTLLGGTSVTEAHISTITDSIILLRYVEMLGEMRRGLTVLKMRGSFHEKHIREYRIDENGLTLGDPFRNVVGILAGHPQNVTAEEVERLTGLFSEE